MNQRYVKIQKTKDLNHTAAEAWNLAWIHLALRTGSVSSGRHWWAEGKFRCHKERRIICLCE